MGLMGPDGGGGCVLGRLVGAPPGHRLAEMLCLLLSQQPSMAYPPSPLHSLPEDLGQ